MTSRLLERRRTYAAVVLAAAALAVAGCSKTETSTGAATTAPPGETVGTQPQAAGTEPPAAPAPANVPSGTKDVPKAVYAAATAELKRLADTAGSGVAPGLTAVFSPVCVSKSGEYASIVATPVFPGNSVGQPGVMLARRSGDGYEIVGGLRFGARYGTRPDGVPAAAFREVAAKPCILADDPSVTVALLQEGGPWVTHS